MSATLFDLTSGVDSADGYLADAWLDRLRAFEFSCRDAAHFLVWLPNIKPHLACAKIDLLHGTTDLGMPAELLEFSTRGWSGAENLIDAMLGHIWIKYLHTKWRRGGHYSFEIPASILRGVEPFRARTLPEPELRKGTT
ncbi:hypothetical protein RZS28_19835 (plasmid) [Methylocapsa polymorpha]|uniref:Uncharacterized protein n=1 Tax=Methylocapsa polymorpha TaxID=3080828 RepID=A0ABZ0HY84_9HYPH|nr:hypothetical protein [Methylocapsa sp. RX1]WOJ91698.1 hypothetical protein RZS28_19835 [Methylocapsa sp. RX1]